MKTITKTLSKAFLLCFILVSTSVLAQTIITIDNNPGSTTTYQNIQDAHDAATAGDIIYVQPSPSSYGNVTIEKSLTIVGRSHSETSNISQLGNVTIEASDVTLKGLLTSRIYNQSPNTTTPITNIKLYECKTGTLRIGYSNYGIDGLEARGCVISGSFTQYARAENVLISNNIITSSLAIYSPSQIIITNNIFRFTSSMYLYNYAAGETAILFNNMFINNYNSSSTVYFSLGDWNASNNLLYNYGDGDINFATSSGGTYSDNNTLLNVDPLFTDVDPTVTYSFADNTTYNPATRPEDDLTLQATSPALTGGGGGSELGLYNNGFNYSTIGNPKDVPTIDIDTYDGAVPKNGTINVTITAKAH